MRESGVTRKRLHQQTSIIGIRLISALPMLSALKIIRAIFSMKRAGLHWCRVSVSRIWYFQIGGNNAMCAWLAQRLYKGHRRTQGYGGRTCWYFLRGVAPLPNAAITASAAGGRRGERLPHRCSDTRSPHNHTATRLASILCVQTHLSCLKTGSYLRCPGGVPPV